MLEHVLHRVPVTALAFLDEHVVLAGEGPYLRAYHVSAGHCIAELIVFASQAIHGIHVLNQSSLLVWGGRSLVGVKASLSNRNTLCSWDKAVELDFTDWILDVASFPRAPLSKPVNLAVVTAHNALALLKEDAAFQAASKPPITIDPVIPGSNCILYSSSVTWLSDSQCLIASGTAFGDIIVWSCSISSSGVDHFAVQSQTHYTFSAHDGSIFDVSISPPLHDGNIANWKRLLASCSDDRTVRIWDISNLTSPLPESDGRQRDTGFGTRAESDPGAPNLLAKAMGHVSRIWHVRFRFTDPVTESSYSNTTESLPLQLLSFGEDATAITWSIRVSSEHTNGKPVLVLEHLFADTAHSGKHIWSLAGPTSISLATGGADGVIALRSDVQRHNPMKEIGHDLSARFAHDTHRAYAYISDGLLLATSNQGRVFSLDVSAETGSIFTEVSQPLPGLQGYSIVTAADGHAFFAGTDGCIYWYNQQESKVRKIADTGGKVTDLCANVASVTALRSGISVLATTISSPIAQIYHVPSLCSESELRPVPATTLLKLPPGFTPRSYTVVEGHEQKNYAAIGSRSGSVAFFELPSVLGEAQIPHALLVPGLHGSEAVTSLLWQRGNHEAGSGGFLHSTGRDGTHCMQEIQFLEDGPKAVVVHRSLLPFGPNIEGCRAAADTRNLSVWGFKSTHFIVFDVTDQREIMRVDCGGAHRKWAFRPGPSGGTFVWTKASKIYRYTQTRRPFRLINAGFHGREIKAVAVSGTEPPLIATGAEDTDIKLSTNSDKGDIRCLQTLRKHNTGIQHLQWLASSTGEKRARSHHLLLFSSGGFEEFFVWRITPDVPGLGVGVVCESIHPRSGKSDLRIMGFESRPQVSDVQAEDRTVYTVLMAYSDSTVREWAYCHADGWWKLLRSADYLTACLTQIVSLQDDDDDDTRLVTTATDGHVTLWARDPELAWQRRVKVHQSTILSVRVIVLPDSSSLVVTGGDDNALGLTRIAHGADAAKTLLIPRAHAAAVTGLAATPWQDDDEHDGLLWVVSAGIDQRVTLWEVAVDVVQPGVDGISVKKLQTTATSVADVSGLELCSIQDRMQLLVYGVGIDMWHVRNS